MAFGEFWGAGFWVRLWQCCGNKWVKVMVSADSWYWFPECPDCGECGDWPLWD